MQQRFESVRSGANSKKAKLFYGMMVGAPLALVLACGQAMGQTRTWRNAANGTFSTGNNWVGNVAPNAGNPVVFGLNSNVNPFTVSFTGDASTAGLTVSNQRPMFNLGGFTYNITGDTLIGGTNGPVVTVTNGTLNTRAGGGRLSVGNNVGQTGTLIVNGGVLNGLWDVGFNGNGTVTIQNGADATVPAGDRLVIGHTAGSTGAVNVIGPGSTLTQSDGTLHVGFGGNATLFVDAGAAVTCGGPLELARNGPQCFGQLAIRGAGSLVTATGLTTSGGARGDITIDDGGRLELPGGASAWDAGTIQNWHITGEGSTLVLGGDSRIATNASTASFDVEAGADVTAGSFFLSDYSSNAQATMFIDGVGTTFTSQWFSALSGSTEMQISSGAAMNVVNGFSVGCCNYGGSSQIWVLGTGTELSVGGNFELGRPNHPGNMTISEGAKLIGDEPEQNMYCYLGSFGTGTINIDGPGSEMRVKNQLRIGWYDGNSNGTVNISNGATATVGLLTLLGGDNSVSAATISGGSILSSLYWVQVHANSTITVSSGSGVEALGGFDIRGSQAGPAEVVVGAESYIFATSQIGVGGSALLNEVGVLTLNEGTAYTLERVYINESGTLRGVGTVEGGVTLSGTIQPGYPIGTLNVNNIGFNSEAQSRLEIQVGGIAVGTQYDRLAVVDNAALSGTLSLSLSNGFVPTAGQTFDILTAGSINGQFSSVTGTDLGSGKAFVAQYLPTSVRVVVDSVTGVDIGQPTIFVVEGYTESLTASATYAASAVQNVSSAVTWISDDPTIATVSANGKVTGVNGGTTTIRASYSGFQDTVDVTIRDLPRLENSTPGLNVSIRDNGLLDYDLLTPFLTTIKSSIQFDGGEANTLSGRTAWYGARFTGRLNITTEGEYSFAAGGDDVVTVWINGKPLAYGRVFQNRPAGTVTLAVGEHDIHVDYGQLDGGNWMGVDFWGPGVPRQRITSGFLVGGQATLEFFDAPQYPFGDEVPDFDQFRVCQETAFPDLNRVLYPGGYDGVMIRHEADLAIPDSGDYTFTVNVDDGAKIWLNGEEVLHAWSPWAWGTNHTFTRTLERGVVPIRVDFTQHQGHYGGLVVSIQGPGITKQPIPAAAFSFGGTPVPLCIGDYNQDGGIDGSDVEGFFADWEAGNAAADVNQDGGIDGSDVELFFERWEAGC